MVIIMLLLILVMMIIIICPCLLSTVKSQHTVPHKTMEDGLILISHPSFYISSVFGYNVYMINLMLCSLKSVPLQLRTELLLCIFPQGMCLMHYWVS